MLKIAITGGICSGKTTITNYFSRLGVAIIDADELSRDILAASINASPSPALLQIKEQFGDNFFDSKGFLIRSKLKHKIFSAKDAHLYKKQLNDIVHPLVYQKIKEQVTHYEKQLTHYENQLTHYEKQLANSPPYIIISIPLLVETSNHYQFDRIIVVDIDRQRQINRCSKRDSIPEQTIENIINSQASREQRLAIADDIIVNNQSLSQLSDIVSQLHKNYLKLSTKEDNV